jgi:hypothetical protein
MVPMWFSIFTSENAGEPGQMASEKDKWDHFHTGRLTAATAREVARKIRSSGKRVMVFRGKNVGRLVIDL